MDGNEYGGSAAYIEGYLEHMNEYTGQSASIVWVLLLILWSQQRRRITELIRVVFRGSDQAPASCVPDHDR